MGYVFRLEKGCFGEDEGGHGRAMGHWESFLNAALKILKIKGGTVVPGSTVWPCQIAACGRFGLHGFCRFVLFLYFCLRNVFGLQAWSNGNLGSDTN